MNAPLRRLLLAVVLLALGAMIGFYLGTSRTPTHVLVPGHPSTLHLFRKGSAGVSAPRAAPVVFDSSTISRFAADLDNLPTAARFGRQCDSPTTVYDLTFDYDNGDRISVEVSDTPCGSVVVLGDKGAVADATGSPLLHHLATKFGQ